MDLIGRRRSGKRLRKKGMRRGEGIDAVARICCLRTVWRGKSRKLLLLLLLLLLMLLLLLLRHELLVHVMQGGSQRRLRRMMTLQLIKSGGGFGVGSGELQPKRRRQVGIKLDTLP